MSEAPLQRWAIIALLLAVVLVVLPNALVILGVPFEVVSPFGLLAGVAFLDGFVLLLVAASRWGRWSLVLAWLALAAETGAALLLLVHEERPAIYTLNGIGTGRWSTRSTSGSVGVHRCAGELRPGSGTHANPRCRRFVLVAAAALVVTRIAQYR